MTALGDFSSGDVLTAADLNAIGTWQDFTPNCRPTTGTITAITIYTAKYCLINNLLVGRLNWRITNVGTGSGALRFDLPVADADYTASNANYGIGTGRENYNTGYTMNVLTINATTADINYYNNAGMVTANNGGGVIFMYRVA